MYIYMCLYPCTYVRLWICIYSCLYINYIIIQTNIISIHTKGLSSITNTYQKAFIVGIGLVAIFILLYLLVVSGKSNGAGGELNNYQP